MKKILSVFGILMATFFASSAFAACGGDTCMGDMPELQVTNLIELDVTSGGGTAGVAEITGLGEEFVGRVDRTSTLSLNTEVEAADDGCDRDCGDYSVRFEGLAFERLDSIGAAVSSTPGETVGVVGGSLAETNLNLNISLGELGSSGGDGN